MPRLAKVAFFASTANNRVLIVRGKDRAVEAALTKKRSG
jgi:hypothetical protein